MVEMKEQLEVTDLKGNKIGVMNVRIKKRGVMFGAMSVSIILNLSYGS
jgi:hypothetical protein